MTRRLIVFLLVACSWAASACRRKEAPTAEGPGVSRLGAVSVCSPSQEEEWTAVREGSLGASGRDAIGHTIGRYPARKFLLVNNWYPMDVVKRTLCGTLHEFNFYDGLGKEADWNNFLIPSGAFIRLLEDARAYAHPGAVRDCGAEDNCVEGEVTPEKRLYEYPNFPKSSGKSPLEGKPLCTYGPWVAEKLHGFRPEIHPSELVWWSEATGAELNHFFLVVQDGSNRFDGPGDYGGPSNRPNWQPWAKSPRSALFWVAFEWNVSEPARTLYVQLEGRKVVTKATDGRKHLLEYEGKPVLRLVEQQAREEDVGVRFVEVCRDPATTRLRGYAEISVKVGEGDEDGMEGFAVLRVGPAQDPLPALPAVGPQATARSPRRVESAGRPRLLVDLELEFSDSARRAPEESIVTDATLSSGRRLPVPTPLPGKRTVIPGVPVEPGVSVIVGLRSGRQVPITLPGLGVAPVVTAETPDLADADPSAWDSLMRSARARVPPAARTAFPQDLTLKAARSWAVSSQIDYAPRRDGEVGAEDDSSLSDELNALVRRGSARELSGPRELFSVKWDFRATDLTTGRPVAVVVNRQATGNRVRVGIAESPVGQANFRVSFPTAPASHIYHLVAQARVTDAFGHTGELRQEVWSHVLAAESPSKLADALVNAAATLAGVAPRGLDEAARLDLRREVAGAEEQARAARAAERDPRRQRARLLRLASERAAEDNLATVGELEQLVRVAALLREQ